MPQALERVRDAEPRGEVSPAEAARILRQKNTAEFHDALLSAVILNAATSNVSPVARQHMVRGMIERGREDLAACVKELKEGLLPALNTIDATILMLCQVRAIVEKTELAFEEKGARESAGAR